MDKRIEKFMDGISPEESAFLDKSLGRTARKADISREQQARILAATMRKAGFEMNEAQAEITVKKSRIKKIAICGIAAAALLSAVGWTAANIGFEKVKEFFGQDMTPYADQIIQTSQAVSNDDLTLSVDGVIADEVQCRVVVSLTPKTKRGEEIVGQLSYASNEYYEDCDKLQKQSADHGDTEEEAHEWYVEQVKKLPPHQFTLYFENAGRTTDNRIWEDMTEEEKQSYSKDDYFSFDNFVFCNSESVVYTRMNDKHHYSEMLTLEMSELDRSQPLKLYETESGLSTEIDINAYFDSHRLVSDDPQAFDYVVISPVAVYIRSTANDIDSGRILMDDGELTSVTVNYLDGTSEKLSNIVIGKRSEDGDDIPEFDTEQERLDYIKEHWDEQTITKETLEACGDKLFELDKISSVTIDGVEYKIQ